MITLGDCLEQMKNLADNSVDAVVTDPPYGLAFMNKKWDYDVPSVDIWREVFRVLKPGGHVLSFGGTRTYHRMVVNIEDAGFEIRDQIQWIYGSGFPKSHDVSKAIDKKFGAEREVLGESPNNRDRSKHNYNSVGNVGSGAMLTTPATPEAKQWQGWGSALKPANEPICLARKPLEKGLTLAENVLKYGTGAINIDGCRVVSPDHPGVHHAGSSASGSLNWNSGEKKESSREYYTPQGRWPANIILDEDAAAMLDVQSGPCKTGGRKIKTNCGNAVFKVDVDTILPEDFDSGASRFFYVAKASKRERNAGLDGMPEQKVSHMITGSGKPSESVKERSAEGEPNRFTATHKNHHPTVKPIKLMEYLIKLITPPNGVILDPFMGSGSTGVAAKNLGFNFIGIEMNADYFEIAKKRIEADS